MDSDLRSDSDIPTASFPVLSGKCGHDVISAYELANRADPLLQSFSLRLYSWLTFYARSQRLVKESERVTVLNEFGKVSPCL